MRRFFEAQGIDVLDVHVYRHHVDPLGIPEEIQNLRTWDEKLLRRTIEMDMKIRQEPSLTGLGKHFVVYGDKR
jgi:hypothetical protein